MKRIFGIFMTTFLIFALSSGNALAKKERIQKHKKKSKILLFLAVILSGVH